MNVCRLILLSVIICVERAGKTTLSSYLCIHKVDVSCHVMMLVRAVLLELGRRSCTTSSLISSFFCVDCTIPPSRLRQRRSFIAGTAFAKSSSSIVTATADNNKTLVTADPTAKRPTRKCDPFGLDGKSLSYEECHTWMSTLEKGWTLIIPPPPPPPPSSDIAIEANGEESQLYAAAAAAAETANPTYLQKHYYHRSFLDASQFITHTSSVATNNNHYPHLSFKRILTSQVVSSSTAKEENEMEEEEEEESEVEKEVIQQQQQQQQHLADKVMNEQCKEAEDDSSSSSSSSPQTNKKLIDKNTANRRRVMGWIVRSTIQCSTYRPTTTMSRSTYSNDDNSSRGLTYHDFHLALCIDVEVKRNTIIQSLLLVL